jgi:hypothetical protein
MSLCKKRRGLHGLLFPTKFYKELSLIKIRKDLKRILRKRISLYQGTYQGKKTCILHGKCGHYTKDCKRFSDLLAKEMERKGMNVSRNVRAVEKEFYR